MTAKTRARLDELTQHISIRPILLAALLIAAVVALAWTHASGG